MNIFKSHHTTDSNLHASKGYHMDENETKSQTSSEHSASDENSSTSSHKSACGCGCSHKTKPVDEEVVEIKEEWDY
jgi:hypothetical protein